MMPPSVDRAPIVTQMSLGDGRSPRKKFGYLSCRAIRSLQPPEVDSFMRKMRWQVGN